MTNVTRLNMICEEYIKQVKERPMPNSEYADLAISAYLPSIARSLAVIADEMTKVEENTNSG